MDGCASSLKMCKLLYRVLRTIAYFALPICDLVLKILLKAYALYYGVLFTSKNSEFLLKFHTPSEMFCKFIIT